MSDANPSIKPKSNQRHNVLPLTEATRPVCLESSASTTQTLDSVFAIYVRFIHCQSLRDI